LLAEEGERPVEIVGVFPIWHWFGVVWTAGRNS